MEIGERHGRLVCIGKDTSRDERYFLFKCDCGNVKSIIAHNVLRGATKSCGCYQKAHRSKNHFVHGLAHSRIDHIYKTMIARCENPKSQSYPEYGAKGIHICEEWKNDKTKFFEWAFANGYAENLTIDRVDNSKGYSPANCRWATYQQQNNNRRSNRFETINGVTHTVADIKTEMMEREEEDGTVTKYARYFL